MFQSVSLHKTRAWKTVAASLVAAHILISSRGTGVEPLDPTNYRRTLLKYHPLFFGLPTQNTHIFNHISEV